MSRRSTLSRSITVDVPCPACGADFPFYVDAPDSSVGFSGSVTAEFDDALCTCGAPAPTVDDAEQHLHRLQDDGDEPRADDYADERGW